MLGRRPWHSCYSTSIMRALVVNSYAHPSNIPLTLDAPEPRAGPKEVIVEVYSAGMNFFDLLQSQGRYQVQPPFPFTLGAEFAGRIAVDSPIPDGCKLRPGDRVFGFTQGAYADRAAVDVTRLQPLPEAITYDQGSGLYITWPTSYESLVGRAQLKAGEWVLVIAAAGGVGIAAVQIARALGAKVIAAAGSQAKLDVATKCGAHYAVDYTKKDWQKEVLKITNGNGADVVFDPVGMIKDCTKCIAWKGRAVVVGFAAGEIEKLPLNLVLLKNIAVLGIHWGAYTQRERERIPVVWKELLALLASGRVKPIVYSTVYPLEKVAEGLVDLEKRRTWGKVAVRIKSDDDQVKAKL